MGHIEHFFFMLLLVRKVQSSVRDRLACQQNALILLKDCAALSVTGVNTLAIYFQMVNSLLTNQTSVRHVCVRY